MAYRCHTGLIPIPAKHSVKNILRAGVSSTSLYYRIGLILNNLWRGDIFWSPTPHMAIGLVDVSPMLQSGAFIYFYLLHNLLRAKANTRRWPYVVLVLARRIRRRPNMDNIGSMSRGRGKRRKFPHFFHLQCPEIILYYSWRFFKIGIYFDSNCADISREGDVA